MKKVITLVLVLVLGSTAEVANADFAFGEPTNLGLNINSSYDEWDPSISTDGLVLFFSSWRPEGYGESDLWVSKRISISDDWGKAVNLGSIVNSTYREGGPSISSDGLELYFDSSRPGGLGSLDLWVARRATKDEDWAPPVNLGQVVNSPAEDQNPCISTDGLEVFFESRRVGSVNYDLWVTSRESLSAEWGPPVNLGPIVNSLYITRGPSISSDGLRLFLCALRAEQLGLYDFDIWVTKRISRNEPWSAPINLGPTLNGASEESNPDISTDGFKLFFASDRPGGLGDQDIWQVQILPVVDLNGDGIVNADDMCIIVDHWGTDNSLCDIGPMPWGDGIVDVQDLIVLAEHLFEEVPPTEPVE